MCAASSSGRPVQTQGADPPPVVARVADYVRDYEQRFTGIVGEERQTQRIVKASGATSKQRTLVSDFVLVRIGDRTSFFRDLATVDGKAVRDRQARLQKLFSE